MEERVQDGSSNERANTVAQQRATAFEASRQAVVIIHGIGDQRPMDTLRGFVDAVLDVDPVEDAEGAKPKYYSKPDIISGSYDLRRLQSSDARHTTDFFEFYWQHLIPTPSWARILEWSRLLLNRRPNDVPTALRGIWRLSCVLAAVIIALVILTVVFWIFPSLAPTGLSMPAALPLGLAAILIVVQGVILNYVGDAAVYLSPKPRNIQARHAIREAGVSLIERLHKGLDDGRRYDRIIVVGHSLGSIVGYDILNFAWSRFHKAHDSPASPTRETLIQAQRSAQQLWELAESSDKDALLSAQKEWRNETRWLWLEQRANTFPWLVTDFITLGSPLTHGLLLLARDEPEFRRKQVQREFSLCPPRPEQEGNFSYGLTYDLDPKTKRTVFCLNRAACFAVTRWTNLYFPTQYWLKGDLIGGPVAEAFGPGILDVPVQTASWNGWLAHTRYWDRNSKDQGNRDASIVHLRDALDLTRRSFD